MKKRVELDKDEQITLQTLIVRQIKKNKGYETSQKDLFLKTEYLEELYQKIAGFKYEGW